MFDEARAVRRGGGQNHRMGLYDAVLIKDNHIDEAGSLAEAVRRVGAAETGLRIEVEARTLDDVRTALALEVTHILLDNMSLKRDDAQDAVRAGGRPRARWKASGNVTLDRVRAIAETGVTYISVGALTHSASVFDVSLKRTGRAAPGEYYKVTLQAGSCLNESNGWGGIRIPRTSCRSRRRRSRCCRWPMRRPLPTPICASD